MERLVHRPNGSLVPDDPYKVVGTRVRFESGGRWRYGTITKKSLERHARLPPDSTSGHPTAVWALWDSDRDLGGSVSWMPRGKVEIVDGEVDS